MEKDELIMALNKEDELYLKIKVMWQKNASEKEIIDELTRAGITVDINTIETVLLDLQKMKMESIGKELLDEQELSQIAGGKYGGMKCSNTEDCDYKFLDGTDLVSLNERCYVSLVCDEFMNL